MTEDHDHEIKTALMTGLPSGLRLPTAEERAAITKEFGLDEIKQHILFEAVLQTMHDLQDYVTNRERRPAQIRHLNALAAALKHLRKVLDRISAEIVLSDIMPIALLEELGGMVTLNTLEQLTPRSRSNGMVTIANQKYKSADEAETIQTIENLTLEDRKTLGLFCGDEVLRRVIDRSDDALRQWASEVSTNKNGCPRDIERDLMIRTLARVCAEVLGMQPAVSTTGRFVDLCHQVLKSCGFADIGIEKAVYRLLARMQGDGANPSHS